MPYSRLTGCEDRLGPCNIAARMAAITAKSRISNINFSLIPQKVEVREFMCCVASFGQMAAATYIPDNLDLIRYVIPTIVVSSYMFSTPTDEILSLIF